MHWLSSIGVTRLAYRCHSRICIFDAMIRQPLRQVNAMCNREECGANAHGTQYKYLNMMPAALSLVADLQFVHMIAPIATADVMICMQYATPLIAQGCYSVK